MEYKNISTKNFFFFIIQIIPIIILAYFNLDYHTFEAFFFLIFGTLNYVPLDCSEVVNRKNETVNKCNILIKHFRLFSSS